MQLTVIKHINQMKKQNEELKSLIDSDIAMREKLIKQKKSEGRRVIITNIWYNFKIRR